MKTADHMRIKRIRKALAVLDEELPQISPELFVLPDLTRLREHVERARNLAAQAEQARIAAVSAFREATGINPEALLVAEIGAKVRRMCGI